MPHDTAERIFLPSPLDDRLNSSLRMSSVRQGWGSEGVYIEPGDERLLPSARAHVVAVSNLKGGTGKSTVSVNLACALASLGARVALVDTDEQGTSSTWATGGRLPVRCVSLPLGKLGELDSWLEVVLKLRSHFDVVLVDSPASVAPALAATYLMASVILVPASPSWPDVAATRRMLRHLNRVRVERLDDPPDVLLVPNRVPVADGPAGEADFRERLETLGEDLAPPLGHRAVFEQAFIHGLWVGAYAPDTAAHREVMLLAGLVAERLDARMPAGWPPDASAPERPRAGLPVTLGAVGRMAPASPATGPGARQPRVPAMGRAPSGEPARRPARRATSPFRRWLNRITGGRRD